MAVATKFSVGDQAFLYGFGVDTLNALLLDDIWTEAAENHDAAAADVARSLARVLNTISRDSDRAHDLIGDQQVELNARWEDIVSHWRLPESTEQALRDFIAEHGGLGDAGVNLSAMLRQELVDEASDLRMKADELDRGGLEIDGDIKLSRRVAMAITGLCVLAIVGLPMLGAAVGAVGVLAGAYNGAAGLATLLGGIAGTTLLTSGSG